MKKTRPLAKAILLTLFLTVFALNTTAQKVTLSFQNETFEKVLNSIKQQTGLSLVFSEQLVNLNRKVSINVNTVSVEDALKQLLATTNLGYEIKNNKLYLVEKKNDDSPKSIIQSKKITGLVTDEKGDPIIGATIIEIGTNKGTVTDINGQFSLETATTGQLKVSFLGYESQTVAISGKSQLKISMSQSSKNLEEIVVVGYGTIKKKDLTGAVSSIKTTDLQKSSAVSVGH